MTKEALPSAFISRKLHSLMGLWLVLFIIEHLLTNSQAALFFGDDGKGFINGVNLIHSLPYLPLIEIFLLGVPILYHAVWGIKYLLTSLPNSGKSDGSTPSLPSSKNQHFTWQRATSWVLLFGILFHVIQMRFLHYPEESSLNGSPHYTVRLSFDEGLYTLCDRLHVELYDQNKLTEIKELLEIDPEFPLEMPEESLSFNKEQAELLIKKQLFEEKKAWLSIINNKPLDKHSILIVTDDFAKATLLVVRDTFKSLLMSLLYTLFVFATCFHAFNGLWTFCITWGVTLSKRSQKLMMKTTTLLMIVTFLLGCSAIWGTYWINLYN